MYESHMTLLCEGDELRRLERWAARRQGVKFTHIALARGRTASQPMLTLRGRRPSYRDELAAVREVGAELVRDGFAVARVKVECVPWAAEVPRDDSAVPDSDHPDLDVALGYVEWHHFAGEYPQFADRGAEFTGRLRTALAPTFAGTAEPPKPPTPE
ncbi:hypothetical protein [Streptomyces anulatus]|uniref:hypothetical protein n=1 Tax=Streptomyces anulatus TaxID=1892 RepID=UPI001F1655E2|nr:hypothetical protein [Streptomyces anulatus]